MLRQPLCVNSYLSGCVYKCICDKLDKIIKTPLDGADGAIFKKQWKYNNLAW